MQNKGASSIVVYRQYLHKFFSVLSIASVAASFLHASAQAPSNDRKQIIPALLHREHVASVSFAQIAGAKTILAEAYGEQSPGVAVGTTTLYNIASMSKPISAEVLLRVASDGKLSLDEPMYKYWVDPDVAADPRSKLLTPRLALDHQTGFANWRRQTGGKLTFTRDPGTGFGYSGEGYQYVARFAEKRTGKSFESLAQDLIFDPSGMTRTAYTQRPWMEGNTAQPTDKDGKWLKPQIATQFVAADLVYTTPTQYASFVESLMRGAGETPAIRNLRETVLIVDDEEPVRRTFREWLTGAGLNCDILTAHDAESALSLANEHVIDLAILDWALGAGDDGLQLLQDLSTFHPDVTAILVTGYANQATPLEAMRMGGRDYLDKNHDLNRETFLQARPMTTAMRNSRRSSTP